MEYVIGIIIAIICGVLVGQDAGKRGMNGAGWGFFVALFCIVGLPMYLILRKPLIIESTGIGQVPMPPTDALKKCPYCAELIKHEAKLCRYCGKDLPI